MTVLTPLLLDLDGTLADTLADITASVDHLRRQFGLRPLGRTAVRSMVGDGLAVLLRRALAEVEPEPAAAAAFWQQVRERYHEHHLEQCTVHVQAYPGVADRLAEWARAGRPLAVVTNKPKVYAERILEHLGLRRFLPVVVGGDCLPQRKPDPAPLAAALARLGAPPGAGAMAGDGVQDLRAGKAAGLRTAAALYGFSDEAELRAEGADEYWRAFGG